MTERLQPTPDGVARAAELLAAGEVVAFPTDTVYGVGVTAGQPERLDALFELKRRPVDKLIPMLVASVEQVEAAGFVADDRARRLIDTHWPGPLTIVLPAADGSRTQGFRAPNHSLALELIAQAGPILATSANISGEPETFDADEVLVAFATQSDRLAAVIDGGPVQGGIASTVVDLTTTPLRIVRAGPVAEPDLRQLAGEP